ncbi:MAG: hypothetical protein ACJ786_18075 [Catenulispora sp.]
MSVRIIETASEEALYRRYDSQTSPQNCYIELDLREGTLSADYDSAVDNAVPFTVYYGFERRYSIPTLTGTAADELMRQIAPLADRILADWEEMWNGNNHVAVLGEDAQAAEEEISAEIGCGAEDRDTDPTEVVTVWDVDGACNGTEVEDYGITADTTDERLDEIEEDIRKSLAEVSDSSVVVLDGVAEYLRGKRNELAVGAAEEAADAAEEAADAATAAALTRARAVARVVEVYPTQYAAAQALGLDQSTVNKLVKKAAGATVETDKA